MRIIFENQHFLAVDKPTGWLCVPSRLGASDLRPCLSTELSAAKCRLWPVHRLDQEVSGLVLFAKSATAHRVANGWFENRQIHKFYEAWTEGEPIREAGEAPLRWESLLLRGKRRAYESPAGKPAITLARWLRTISFRGSQAQVWELEPLTGRAHQLRYELARHGHAILGDELYGSKIGLRQGAIALRSCRLDFKICPDAAEFGLPSRLEVEGLPDA